MADLEGVCSIVELTIGMIQAGDHQFVECMCLLLRYGSSHFEFTGTQRLCNGRTVCEEFSAYL